MSIKDDLIGKQIVMGNLKESLQMYRMYYYHPEAAFPSSKVWLYFNRDEKVFNKKKNQWEYKGIKSLCFDNIAVHQKFIFNNILYNLYWLEKQGIEFKPSQMNIYEYRKALLDSLMNNLRKKLLKKIEEMSRIKERIEVR